MPNPADHHTRYYRSFCGRSLRTVEVLMREFGAIRLASKRSAAYADTVVAQSETDRNALRAALRAQPMTEVSYV